VPGRARGRLVGELLEPRPPRYRERNPPAERELLSLDLAQRFKSLRAYVVAPEIHQALCENSKVPLLEFHAKNVGIRRAKSDWVVATNADAAFGPDIVNRLLGGDLTEDVVFSAQRIDIPWREGRETQIGALDCLRYRRVIPYHPLGTGEFGFASRRLWERARGYDESLVRHRIGVDKLVSPLQEHLRFGMLHRLRENEAETRVLHQLLFVDFNGFLRHDLFS